MRKTMTSGFTVCFMIISVCIMGFSTQVEAQPTLEKVKGAWRLISVESVLLPSNQIVYVWMGKNPLGLIIYDQSGFMSVQFMRDPRPLFSSGSGTHRDASPEEVKIAYSGYYAYFGTYEINESEGAIVHNVKASLQPHEV